MKSLVGFGALLAGALLLASDANACWGRRHYYSTVPASAPAAAVDSQGATSYGSAYQAPAGGVMAPAPARSSGMTSPSMDRAQYLHEYQLYRRSGR